MSMLPPEPELGPSERRALNADVKRSDATGFRDEIAKCPDFEYLCEAAEKVGWIVHLSAGDYIEKPRNGRPGRRALESIRIKPNATAPAKVAVAIESDLALASKVALTRLMALVKKK